MSPAMLSSARKNFEDDFFKIDGVVSSDCWFNGTMLIKQPFLEKVLLVAKREVCNTVSVPGFRKEKVPIAKIMGYARNKVENAFVSALVKHCMSELSRFDVVPLNVMDDYEPLFPDIRSSFSDEIIKGVLLKVSFECRPLVPVLNWDVFDVDISDEPKITVTKKEIALGIMDTRMFFAKEHEKSTPAQANDVVIFEVESAPEINGDWFKDVKYRVLLDSEFVDKSLLDRLNGVSVGRSIDIVLPVIKDRMGFVFSSRDDYKDLGIPENEIVPNNKVRIKISKVLSLELPNGESWVQSLGASSWSDFESKVKQQIEKRKHLDWLMQNRILIQKFLLDEYSFDVPDSWVKETYKSMYGTAEKEPQESEKMSIRKEISRDIAMQLILYKFAQENNIKVEEKDNSGYIQKLVLSGVMSIEQANSLIEQTDWEKKIEANVLLDKTLDFMVYKLLENKRISR